MARLSIPIALVACGVAFVVCVTAAPAAARTSDAGRASCAPRADGVVDDAHPGVVLARTPGAAVHIALGCVAHEVGVEVDGSLSSGGFGDAARVWGYRAHERVARSAWASPFMVPSAVAPDHDWSWVDGELDEVVVVTIDVRSEVRVTAIEIDGVNYAIDAAPAVAAPDALPARDDAQPLALAPVAGPLLAFVWSERACDAVDDFHDRDCNAAVASTLARHGELADVAHVDILVRRGDRPAPLSDLEQAIDEAVEGHAVYLDDDGAFARLVSAPRSAATLLFDAAGDVVTNIVPRSWDPPRLQAHLGEMIASAAIDAGLGADRCRPRAIADGHVELGCVAHEIVVLTPSFERHAVAVGSRSGAAVARSSWPSPYDDDNDAVIVAGDAIDAVDVDGPIASLTIDRTLYEIDVDAAPP